MLSHLSIGTSTNRIDLLRNESGFGLVNWRPVATDHQSSWRSSTLSPGRQIASFKYTNIIETFDVGVIHASQNQAIRDTQDLRRVLQEMLRYWAEEWGDDVVYLQARSLREANTRYAIVYDGRLPEDGTPYSPAFEKARPEMENLSLLVERGPWLSDVPGESTCVEISAEGEYNPAVTSISDQPLASADDCDANRDTKTVTLGNTIINLGVSGGGQTYDIGVRFVNVNVPAGATILSAYVRFRAAANDSVALGVNIFGELDDQPVTFTTDYSDFSGRPKTSNFVTWTLGAWVTGNDYDTPDISSVIQEIVDLPDWAAPNDDIVIFLLQESGTGDRRAYAFDDLVEPAPTLYIEYSTPAVIGQDETCDNQVFVANHHKTINLTHIFQYDASVPAYSVNRLCGGPTAPFPFPGVNDAIYFGVETVGVSGPFCSLVLFLNIAQQDLQLDWEYWNGAWVALSVQDNTNADGFMSGEPFDTLGVNSVHWTQPADWTTVAVNGVTGWWVRLRITVVGGAVVEPGFSSWCIYTISWAMVDIDDAQVGGDLPALARALLYARSSLIVFGSSPPYPDTVRACHRFLLGLRRLDRGASYTPYVNISDVQNPSGVTVYLGSGAAWRSSSETPTGRNIRYTPLVAAESSVSIIRMAAAIATQYYGTFRVFLRVRHNLGTNDEFSVRARFISGWGGIIQWTESAVVETNSRWYACDLGLMSIPPRGLLAEGEETDYLSIGIYVTTDSLPTGGTLDLIDLVLFPVDEMAIDALSDTGLSGSQTALGTTRVLDIDSLLHPRRDIRALLRREADDTITTIWTPRNRQMMLHQNKDQRLWFFGASYVTDHSQPTSEHEVGNSVQLFRNQQYSSMRGDR